MTFCSRRLDNENGAVLKGNEGLSVSAQGGRGPLAQHFDAVVMLTVSNWPTEPRSNRYHFATRFARHLPVLFVQPDRLGAGYSFSDSGHPGIELVHVTDLFDDEQTQSIVQALRERGIRRPLLWIYSGYYARAVAMIPSSKRVLHATEDYFQEELRRQLKPSFYLGLDDILSRLDLLVPVTTGVRDSYVEKGGYRGDVLVLENGCDFKFWQSLKPNVSATEGESGKKVALYQGGINFRLDFDLIGKVVKRLPDWEFRFCGALDPKETRWSELKTEPNVRDLGMLAPEQIAEECWRATVGIIPFVQTPIITNISLPLKAFEYVACDLPVITTPIRALERWPDIFSVAPTADAFAAAIETVAAHRQDTGQAERRKTVAEQQDYDTRFEQLVARICPAQSEPIAAVRLKILVLYAANAVFTSTVTEHLSAFRAHSRYEVVFAHAVNEAPCLYDMAQFDVVVVHYSVRLSLPYYISPHVVESLTRCDAHKVLFIQDEYENTEQARRWIEHIGFKTIFTCIPDGQASIIYPPDRFPDVEFKINFTGYVPRSLEIANDIPPLAERPLMIGFRSRPLHFRFGHLGRDKYVIGHRMRAICRERGIPHDIEVEEEKRIYGADWYKFLKSCRAFLGSESGSNIFDFDGSLIRCVDAAMRNNPWLTYEEVHERYLVEFEKQVRMGQVSPRVFECVACRTALILFRGNYSNVVEPDTHYIPLERDFSNVDEVLERINDLPGLEALTERAYRDVIGSRKYNYESFVTAFDDFIGSRVKHAKPIRVGTAKHAPNAVRGSLTDTPLPLDELDDPPTEETPAMDPEDPVARAVMVPGDMHSLSPFEQQTRKEIIDGTPSRTLLEILVRRASDRVAEKLPDRFGKVAKKAILSVTRTVGSN